jgi:hypothetical protein
MTAQKPNESIQRTVPVMQGHERLKTAGPTKEEKGRFNCLAKNYKNKNGSLARLCNFGTEFLLSAEEFQAHCQNSSR